MPHHTSAWRPTLPCHTRTSAARSGFGGCLPHGGGGVGLVIMGVSLSAGTSPAGRCQEHLCSSPTAPLVWNAAQSAAVLSHAAPRPSAQCFTILIQRETFSQLLLFPSLCFGADLKKKRERKSMKPRISWTPLFPSPSAPFWKYNVKFNSEHNSNLIFLAFIYDEKTSAECEISRDSTACLLACLPHPPVGLESYTSLLELV